MDTGVVSGWCVLGGRCGQGGVGENLTEERSVYVCAGRGDVYATTDLGIMYY